jgi:hypothetical protein
MERRCEKHIFEVSEDRCGKCGNEFCAECLVYSFGPKKPPFCISCAVAAAGIRSTAGNAPAMGRREMKILNRERMAALKRLSQMPAEAPEPAADPDHVPTKVPSSLSFPQAF